MKYLMAIGLVIALTATATAEPTKVYYPGSRCWRIDIHGDKAGSETAKVPSLFTSVSEMAKKNLDNRKLDVCTIDLAACQSQSKPESRGITTAKWLTVGFAIGVAFIGGVWVGSKV